MSRNAKSENRYLLHGLATAFPEDDAQSPQTVYFEPPRKKKYPLNWLLLWQTESDVGVSLMEQACSERPLSQTEYRVRDYLLGTIGIGNMVYVNQAEIARKLSVRAATVCSAIKELIKREIIIPGPKSGRNNTYMISPAFCFLGGLGDGIKARKETIESCKAKIIEFNKNRTNDNEYK